MSALPDALFGIWIHSHEQDRGDIRVYHTRDYDFPLARGRRGFEIRRDGAFVRHDIAPTDGLRSVPGNWENPSPGQIEVTFPDEPGRTLGFIIVACDDQTLEIRL